MSQDLTVSPRGDLAGSRQHEGVAAASETAVTLQVLMQAARDPNVKPENLERYLAMHKELLADQRKEEFNAAMGRLQPRLPRIKKNGRIEIVDKQTGQVKQSTPFARYEDLDRVIRPLLFEEGFTGFSFTTEERTVAGGGIVVHGKLSHKCGHSEVSSMPVPLDTSGSKNNIQGMGSSLSYGKRYLVCAMLNIITEGEDTDGHQVTGPIGEREVNMLIDLMKQAGMDPAAEAKFKTHMKVKALSDILLRDYPQAVYLLQAKVNQQKKAAAGPPADLPDHKDWPDNPSGDWFKVAGKVYRWNEDAGSFRAWEAK